MGCYEYYCEEQREAREKEYWRRLREREAKRDRDFTAFVLGGIKINPYFEATLGEAGMREFSREIFTRPTRRMFRKDDD